MRMRMRRGMWLGVLSLGLAACGGGESDDSMSDDGDMLSQEMGGDDLGTQPDDMGSDTEDQGMADPEVATYAAFREAKNRADCERDQRCDLEGDVDDCVNALVEDLGEARDGIQESIDAGRILYSSSDASSCLEAVRGDCEQSVLELLMICNPVLEGAVEPDGACERMADCADAEGASLGGPFCYDGCEPVTGEEGRMGVCVLSSPLSEPECQM